MGANSKNRRTDTDGGKQQRSVRKRDTGDSEFINRELSVEEVAEYRTWRDDIADVTRAWSELCEAGYKTSTRWDDYGDCFATFVFPGDDSENSGLILTGRGGNPYRSLAEALFKHEFIFRGAWSVNAVQRARADDPDF